MAFTNSLAGRATLGRDSAWIQLVTIGVLRTAGAVLAEGAVGPPAVHAQRLALGRAVLDDPEAFGRRFAQALASDVAITTDTPADQVVLDTISAWWNHFAGVDV